MIPCTNINSMSKAFDSALAVIIADTGTVNLERCTYIKA
jgi:hypothetical protein